MPASIKRVGNLVPNYKSGLEIAADAYSAVNKENIVTSSEDFNFNPVGVYDTVKGEWVEIDIDNPDTWGKYLEGDPSEWKDRYSVAFGTDMDNIDGFMNIEDLTGNMETETSDINGDPNANGPIAQYTDAPTSGQEKPKSTTPETGESGIEVPDILKTLPKDYGIKDAYKNMGTTSESGITIGGTTIKLHKYLDGSATIYYKEGETNYWYRYGYDGKLTDIQIQTPGQAGKHYDVNGNLKPETTVDNTVNNTVNGSSGKW